MSLDFTKLVAQGRAKSLGKAWEPHELEALLALERERSLSRPVAADFIRNGILTPEAYDAAKKQGFTPLSLEDAKVKAESDLAERGKEVKVKDKTKAKGKKTK